MSVLSNGAIVKNLGKGILFYPLQADSIRSCSLCLTASEYAYSLQDRKRVTLYEDKDKDKKYFVIKPEETVLVWTQEAIYLSNKFAGTIHSTVGLVSQGIGHIGTRINPAWIGVLCIALNNLSKNNPVKIYIGDAQKPIAYVMVHELSGKANSEKDINKDEGARLDVLEGLQETQSIKSYFNRKENQWMKDVTLLQNRMKDDDIYKNLKDNLWKKCARFLFGDSKNFFAFLAFTLSGYLFILGQYSNEKPLVLFPKSVLLKSVIFAGIIWMILLVFNCLQLWENFNNNKRKL